MNNACKSCGYSPVKMFFELTDIPVHSVLNVTDQAAASNFTTGSLRLGFCERCGFISNTAFAPELLEYDTGYEATQSYSATFNAFADKQARTLIERHGLYGKDLLEIGCGNGEFLILLCGLGGNRGVGFDPAYIKDRVKSNINTEVRFIKDFYSEKYSDLKTDFLYCKMTLEHIPNVSEFVGMVRRSIGEALDTVVFFQVPDVTRILSDCTFEDIYYEHCSYFSPGSLARLFRHSGFDVTGLETDYAGQYVTISAKPANQETSSFLREEKDLEKLKSLVDAFPGRLHTRLSNWRQKFDVLKTKNRRAVIWGSGSKGVSFLKTLGITDEIQYAVDINPYRQGTYMAGTGHEIISPEALGLVKPDTVIIMNEVYTQEIRSNLHKLGLTPEVLTLNV